jgi:hypothetical protein
MITVIAVILGSWFIGMATYAWVLKSALYWSETELTLLENNSDEIWQWLVNANGRRKRVERILRKQLAKNAKLRKDLFTIGWELGTTKLKCIKLATENEALHKRNQALAGELVDKLLTAQDREGVVQGLTRKV